MDTVAVIAIFSGISGFLASMVALVLGILRQNSENKKNKLEENKYAAEATSNMLGSAKALSDMQKEVYESVLNQCKQELDELKIELISVRKKLDEALVKLEIQQGIIDVLTTKDIDSSALICRLIKGINILVKQLKKLNIEPDWKPSPADLKTENIENAIS